MSRVGNRVEVDRNTLISKAWRFERDDGGVIASSIKLSADGRIEGHSNSNDHRWNLDDGKISFFTEEGDVSCIFARGERSADNDLIFTGDYLLSRKQGVRHVLREVQENIYPLRLAWEAKFEEFFHKYRIFLRHPFQTRGVYPVGRDIVIPGRIRVESYASMPSGGFYSSGAYSYCAGQIQPWFSVGRYCSLASNIQLMGNRHPIDRISTNPVSYDDEYEEIAKEDFGVDYKIERFHSGGASFSIGNDVWIGEGVLLGRNVRLHDGAVVAARSIVTKDVPPYSVVAGAPATVRKLRFSEAIIEQLLALRWWDYNYTDLPRAWSEPERFVGELTELVENSKISKFTPPVFEIGRALHRLSQE